MRDANLGPSESAVTMPTIHAPHVVILGAGASLAALPNGDTTGRHLPLMDNLVQTVGLEGLLDTAGVSHLGRNFEDVYSELVAEPKYAATLGEAEKQIYNYFSVLALPDGPTLYDHLVLSLRTKDLIATFNWDPLLFQAHRRCRRIAPSPHLAFLHGNVAIGYCDCAQPLLFGAAGLNCARCERPLKRSPLLFPIRDKDYSTNPLIAAAWHDLGLALSSALLLTVFGYGAPRADTAAIDLMGKAWGDPDDRWFEETEIIDIKSKDELGRTWKGFIHTTHWGRYPDFYGTFLTRHPRRSCEALVHAMADNNPDPTRDLPTNALWPELGAFLEPLIEDENA